jgi:hypothetical protein
MTDQESGPSAEVASSFFPALQASAEKINAPWAEEKKRVVITTDD